MTTPVNHQQQPAQGASSKACPLFESGQIVATPAALELLETAGVQPMALVARHLCGDFGNLDAEDEKANREAIREGFRVLSSYQLTAGKVWVITEADRSVTTVLLPSDY